MESELGLQQKFSLPAKMLLVVFGLFHIVDISYAEDPKAAHDKMALYLAAASGTLSEAEKLLNQGFDPNIKNPIGGQTALQAAAFAGRADMVRLLVGKGAKVDEPSENGETALMAGIQHLEIVKLLIELGANVNHQGVYSAASRHAGKKGFTPLIEATLASNIEVIKYLTAKGADKNIQTHNGKTACDFALRGEKQKQAEVLKALACKEPSKQPSA